MTPTITWKIFLALKRNIEMRLGSKLQEMGWDSGNGENKIVIFKLGNAHLALVYNQTVSIARNTAGHLKYYQ
jgi:hypothetical protein